MIVLDTSVVIDFIRGDQEVAKIIASAENEGEAIGISAVSLFELLTPLRHKSMPEKERVLRAFLRNLVVLPLDSDASEESAKIMGSLLRIGRPLNVLDPLVAGTASANNARVLITRDKDYEEIKKVSALNVRIALS